MTIYKGDNTGAFGRKWLKVVVKLPQELVYNKIAIQIGNLEPKKIETSEREFYINLTAEETKQLNSCGTIYAAIFDEHGAKMTLRGEKNFTVNRELVHVPDEWDGEGELIGAVESEVVFTDDCGCEHTVEFVLEYTPSKLSQLEDDIGVQETKDTVAQLTVVVDDIVDELDDVVSDITDINSKIPETASETNKLADIKFVIDKIQENSAHFRGNWATYSAIPTNPDLYPVDDEGNHKPTIHDYLIVMEDETQGGGTWRYTYIGEWDILGKSGWNAEYEIKDVPFTDRQWNAINSGATVEKIEQIADNATNIDNLNGRVTQNESDIQTLNSSKLEVSNIKAGNNITLGIDGNDITINSTGGGGGGASSFDELSGSPYDNEALANALNEKASEEDLQAVNDDLAQIHIDLGNKAEVSALNQTNENLSALTGDVENVSGQVTAHAAAIQNLEADKADKSTTYTKENVDDLLDFKANQNELDTVEAIAKGAQQGVAFVSYQSMVTNVNGYAYDKYNVGQSIYIVTREVPDLWVSAKYQEAEEYTYTTDEAITNALKTTGYIRVGRYQLSALETGKVDLSEYAKTTDLEAYIKKEGDETHNGKLTNTGVVDISIGSGAGALILGADVGATTRTSGARKLARINAPTNESNLDIPTTILSFDTQGDTASTIGQIGTGIYNRIEFGGRLGATTVTAPDGIAFTVAKTHNGMQQNQKVYAIEMDATQARFNVRPNYIGASLATINDLPNVPIKGVQQNGVDLVPDASGKVNVQATLVEVIEND